MNRPMVLYTLCNIMRVESALMAPALIIAIACGEVSAAKAFFWSIVVLNLAGSLTFLKKPRKKILYARDGLIIVAAAWIAVSVFGCLPFYWSGAIPKLENALFETVSGFTTTGATILSDIESLPISILYWRSFTHWVGGMGVLVFLLAIIPLTKNSGHSMHLLRAESPGPQVDKIVPRMQSSAKWLYGIYIGLTAALFIALLLCGLDVFDSITTAFSTAGTGGFAVWNDSLASQSLAVQNTVIVFMLLFGVNFNIFYLVLVHEYRRILKNQELWAYLVIVAVSSILIAVNLAPFMKNQKFGEIVQISTFQVASIITTTGFATSDYIYWPQFSQYFLLILMCCGACAGSTSGGMKVSRLLIIIKSFVRDVGRVFRPMQIKKLRLNGAVIEEPTVISARAFFVAYTFLIALSAFIISLDGFSFAVNASAALTCVNNVGPGLGMIGPFGNYDAFSPLSKFILMFDMLAGRLEIFPLLVLFVPAAWKS